ncbi:MAG: DNA repair protein RecN [Planctomycetes bacterium]|nr:DNA repair protein RecN [Planctomycetota bacterium]
MLTELEIRDLALIERAELTFGAGLNTITGETGAGKSLLVGALELLCGDRPRPNLVRSGAARASVEARFSIGGTSARGSGAFGGARALVDWIARELPVVAEDWEALDPDAERELILARSVGADGRTKSHVNGRAVTVKQLAELAPRVFEIHGQNDHQRLLEPAEQMRLLDAFGGLEPALASYREARAAWLALVERLAALEAGERERRDRLDLARFQAGELRAARPDAEERAALTAERELLRHGAELRQVFGGLVDELVDSDRALLSRLQAAAKVVRSWRARVASLANAETALDGALVHLEDAARELQGFAERVETDPARLDAIEERLAELERLERKYSTDCAGLARLADELEAEIRRLEGDETSVASLGAEIDAARKVVLERGLALRRGRAGLCDKLAKSAHAALAELGLERARFAVALEPRDAARDASVSTGGGRRDEHAPAVAAIDLPADSAADAPNPRGATHSDVDADRTRFGESGLERIEFRLSANPGEPLARLRDVASGGETARIMLALRSVLAAAGAGRTLVFDEIDSGVGGRLGPEVAARLKKLGRHHQVLCVTHLPAIAAAADLHLRVSKVVEKGRTHTRIETLSGDARIEEVADMIAGGAAHATARAEARRLIGSR